MSWTQPLCVRCWNNEHPTEPPAVSQYEGPQERCCKCGAVTYSGIYIRRDPSTVPYPS